MSSCPICLRLLEPSTLYQTECHHEFCTECLQSFIKFRAGLANADAACPMCQTRLPPQDIEALSPEATDHFITVRTQLDTGPHHSPAPPEIEAEERNFVRLARAQHFRRCPACQAPVQKNGGCNNMTCACGHAFLWNTAEILYPCSQIHFVAAHGSGLIRFAGSTCPECPSTAGSRAKLLCYRAAVAPVVIPAVIASRAILSSAVLTGAAVRSMTKALRSQTRKPSLSPGQSPNIKLLVLGGRGSGKTSLLFSQFGGGEPGYTPTIFEGSGRSISTRQDIACVIYPSDTSGQEAYPVLRQLMYPGTHVALICVDVTDPDSLEAARAIIPELKRACPTCAVMLVGTHVDLREQTDAGAGVAVVGQAQGDELAAQLRCNSYRECCSTDLAAVNEVFQRAYELALEGMFELRPKRGAIRRNSTQF